MLFPEDLIVVETEKKTKEYKLEVGHCSCCPFSYEVVDDNCDYIGNNCTIEECQFRLNDEETIPKQCPLRSKKCKISIMIKK